MTIMQVPTNWVSTVCETYTNETEVRAVMLQPIVHKIEQDTLLLGYTAVVKTPFNVAKYTLHAAVAKYIQHAAALKLD